MWSNRRSIFLLVHIKHDKKVVGWYIPVALPVIQATLESWRETMAVWERIFPGMLGWSPRRSQRTGERLHLSTLFTWCIRLLRELRQYGQYELVHVETGRNQISVRLW